MSVNKDLRWLRAPGFQGAAKRFTEFCKTDIPQQAKIDPEFDIEIYSAAAKLIRDRLQTSSSDQSATKDKQ